jgi:hypothetical protein
MPTENPSARGVFSYNLRFPRKQYDADVGALWHTHYPDAEGAGEGLSGGD